MCLQLKWTNINLSSLRARPDLYCWPPWAFVWQMPLLLLSSSLEINPLMDLLDSGWKCSAAAIHHSGAGPFDVGLLWPTGGLEMDCLTVPPRNSLINPTVWPQISLCPATSALLTTEKQQQERSASDWVTLGQKQLSVTPIRLLKVYKSPLKLVSYLKQLTYISNKTDGYHVTPKFLSHSQNKCI